MEINAPMEAKPVFHEGVKGSQPDKTELVSWLQFAAVKE